MLRQWKYRDYYHANLTQEEEMHRDIHAGNQSLPLSALDLKPTPLKGATWKY